MFSKAAHNHASQLNNDDDDDEDGMELVRDIQSMTITLGLILSSEDNHYWFLSLPRQYLLSLSFFLSIFRSI